MNNRKSEYESLSNNFFYLHPFFWILKTMLKQLLKATCLNYQEIHLSQTLLFFLGLFPNLSLTHYTAAPTDC